MYSLVQLSVVPEELWRISVSGGSEFVCVLFSFPFCLSLTHIVIEIMSN